jgi:hypothetical protein
MTDHRRLLQDVRMALERYMIEDETMRDDLAELCMKIDDVLEPDRLARFEELDRLIA